jgi:hypothetical protein
MNWISEAKSRLPMPRLLEVLGLEQHAKKSAKCPFHEDRRESFSVFHGEKGWRFKCHAGCGEGDEIDFLALHLKTGEQDARQRYRDLALGSPVICRPQSIKPVEERRIEWPKDLCESGRTDWEQVARIRNLSVLAVGWAVDHGTLKFGTVYGHPCWILTDTRGLCAEARRMDGKPFPALGGLSERKAHTLKGSQKSWPVGLCVKQPDLLKAVHWVALVEGGPDYLAALHFALAGRANFLPVAMLGASNSLIHPEALKMLRGKRVRIFAHCDPNEQGMKATHNWGGQLWEAGAEVDGWSFEGLRMEDGRLVKDLNDCTRIHPEDGGKLEGAWL